MTIRRWMRNLVRYGNAPAAFKREKAVKFRDQDLIGYAWQRTRYLYGTGYDKKPISYTNLITGPENPHNDVEAAINTWNVPILRHEQRKLEFFVPGLLLGYAGKDSGFVIGYLECYVLSEAEQAAVRKVIADEFDAKIRREREEIIKELGDYVTPKTLKRIKPASSIVVLFGNDVYKGTDPEIHRDRVQHHFIPSSTKVRT